MSSMNQDAEDRMRQAIVALPEPTRCVYLLHLADGLSYLAIASRLQLSVAEVEDHVARAIVGIDRHLRCGRNESDL